MSNKFTGIADLKEMACEVRTVIVKLTNKNDKEFEFTLKELDMEELLQSPTGSKILDKFENTEKKDKDGEIKLGVSMLVDAFVESVVDGKGNRLSSTAREKLKKVFRQSFDMSQRVEGGIAALRLMGFDKIGILEKNSKRASSGS